MFSIVGVDAQLEMTTNEPDSYSNTLGSSSAKLTTFGVLTSGAKSVISVIFDSSVLSYL